MSPTRKAHPEPPEYPLTLRNLRLALAGRFGRPYTQEDLAKKLKVSRSHVANIERGHEAASQFLLYRVAEFYEIDLQLVRLAARGSAEKLDERFEKSKRNPTLPNRRRSAR